MLISFIICNKKELIDIVVHNFKVGSNLIYLYLVKYWSKKVFVSRLATSTSGKTLSNISLQYTEESQFSQTKFLDFSPLAMEFSIWAHQQVVCPSKLCPRIRHRVLIRYSGSSVSSLDFQEASALAFLSGAQQMCPFFPPYLNLGA